MQTNKIKKIAYDKIMKIFEEFRKINSFSMALIKYGTFAALILLSLGISVLILNQTVLDYNSYTKFVATMIIKNSIVLMAEFIIGGLVIDYFVK
ncbi:hypothetical protein [Acetivibrio clariflavus]|uniref:Uncharacterized protein n=1 Tax=Acetivibrio clariflavus (strain DSM 19732 / NBRC 101661 / EBR45) TaxID=720554 RepID=G8LWP9_ACECE|nr:hypothetical protein [Acetivibrio clariflavus]AEV68717.1 hypothetical protein Clocl_2123 [Acetivibrio clariflavus DSM 19732]